MTEERVLAEFRAAGALLEGHSIFSSARRLRRTARPWTALPQRIRETFGPVGLPPGDETARGRHAPVPSKVEGA